MKTNTIKPRRSRTSIIAVVLLAVMASVAAGIFFAYQKLAGLWNEQFVITDVATQATVTEGSMVKGVTVLDALGIRNNANLAEIDFHARREELLKRIPNIRSISISRIMPNRIAVTVEERTPVVKMAVKGKKTPSGRVADTDGVVFTCRRGTNILPTISEGGDSATQPGERLSGHKLAALRMIETSSTGEYPALGILEVDTTKPDFLVATLGNYAIAKIRWDGIDHPTPANQQNLANTLLQLNQAIQSNVGGDAKIWIAIEPGRIYADTRERIL